MGIVGKKISGLPYDLNVLDSDSFVYVGALDSITKRATLLDLKGLVLNTLGTISIQNSDSVNITGGFISGTTITGEVNGVNLSTLGSPSTYLDGEGNYTEVQNIDFGFVYQIPIVNSLTDNYVYSANFEYNQNVNNFRVARGSTSSSLVDTFIQGSDHTLNISGATGWSVVTGEKMEITSGGVFNNSFMTGFNNKIITDSNIFLNFVMGASNEIYGTTNLGTTRHFQIGTNNIIGNQVTPTSLQNAMTVGFFGEVTASGAMSISRAPFNQPGPRLLSAGITSLNIGVNTVAQTVGHGSLALSSAIFGGVDSNIPSDSDRSVVIGGNLIKADAGILDTVFLPKLRIGRGTGGSIIGGTNENLLVLDGSTGEVKQITQSSIAFNLTNGNGTTANGSSVDLGGIISTNNTLLSRSVIGTSTFSIDFSDVTGSIIGGRTFMNISSGNKNTHFQVNVEDLDNLANRSIFEINMDSQSFISSADGGVNSIKSTISVNHLNSDGVELRYQTLTDNSIIRLNGSGIEIASNNITSNKIDYVTNYSGSYVNRSLVDKEYVDTSISNIPTFSLTNGNGTTANGTAVDLGGVLSSDIVFTGSGNLITPNNITFGSGLGGGTLSTPAGIIFTINPGTGFINMAGNILPNITNTHSLGSLAARWLEVNSASFNGVSLTTSGLATNFLNEQGNYVAVGGGFSVSNEANNRVITSSGIGTGNAEAEFSYVTGFAEVTRNGTATFKSRITVAGSTASHQSENDLGSRIYLSMHGSTVSTSVLGTSVSGAGELTIDSELRISTSSNNNLLFGTVNILSALIDTSQNWNFQANDLLNIGIIGNPGIRVSQAYFTNHTTTNAETVDSDLKLKTDIVKLESEIENVNKINSVTYKWIDKNKGEDTHYGVIAQEVEKIYPNLVNNNGKNLTVRYGEFIPILIKSIQELTEKINKLEKLNSNK